MAGEEILIADGTARDREGMIALAERLGLVPSAVDTSELARDRIAGKFYAVLMVDLDLPGGGLELIEFTRVRSPATQLLALTSRKNFDAAVQAFRAGCVDVVSKKPEESQRLERGLEMAIDRYHSVDGQSMRGVIEVLDEMIRTIIALGRKVYAGDIESLTEASHVSLNLLFVDDDTQFLNAVGGPIANIPMDAFVEMSAGGALDKLGEHVFDIVVVKAAMSDLPGSIVINAAQQRNEECIALTYSAPGPNGRIDKVVDGKVAESYTPFTGAQNLAERIRSLVEEEHTRRRERKVLQVIGSKHSDALRKYSEAKRRLQAMKR